MGLPPETMDPDFVNKNARIRIEAFWSCDLKGFKEPGIISCDDPERTFLHNLRIDAQARLGVQCSEEESVLGNPWAPTPATHSGY